MTLERDQTASTPTARSRVLGLSVRLLPPVLLALAVRWWLGTAVADVKIDPWLSKTWIHWDGELYLGIAQHGYSLEHCRSVWAPSDWCGNAGWMPLYPAVVRWLGGATELGAAAIAFLACALMLGIVWNGFLQARLTLQNVAILCMAAVFPGHIYQQAAFPTSLTLCLLLLALWFAEQRRFPAAGVAGAVAVTGYPLGVLIAPVLGVWTLLAPALPPRRRWLTALSLGVGVAVGLVAVAGVFKATVGHADAYLLVQAKYGFERSNPLYMLLDKIHGIADVGLEKTHMWTGLQTLLVLVWVICLLPRRGGVPLDAREKLLLLYTLIFWFVPLTAGTRLDLYRSEALLVPSVLLARRLSPGHQAFFLGAFFLLARPMARLYFTGLLE